MTFVPPSGPPHARVLLVGEAPGREEAAHGRPFVGRAGQEQDLYLSRYGLTTRLWRCVNLVPVYTPGNPDPTPDQIQDWEFLLYGEIESCSPDLIVTVGNYSTRWFLGDVSIRNVHGVPTRSSKASNSVILPVIHPASGFYEPRNRGLIAWDYSQVARVIKVIEQGKSIVREDEFLGQEVYLDVSGEELSSLVEGSQVLGLDTEGTLEKPWSIQVSNEASTGYVLRCSRDDFYLGVQCLQDLADNGCLFVLHNASTPQGCLFDVKMCQLMGLDLIDAEIWDTMYAAYLLRTEPQGLKALAYRWCGAEMSSYSDIVKQASYDLMLSYLFSVSELSKKRCKFEVVERGGTVATYSPQTVVMKANKIISDIQAGKEVDIKSRWYNDSASSRERRNVLASLRREVELELGPLPEASFDDIDLDEAVKYAARDADITLRLYPLLNREIGVLGLRENMEHGMNILPIFFRMQECGMPVDRIAADNIISSFDCEAEEVRREISGQCFGGQPFNPNSNKDVSRLLLKRGITDGVRTKTGALSTAKPAIEEHRFTDPVIEMLFKCRELRHGKDSFAVKFRDMSSDDGILRCNLLPTRTTSRRLASKNPNLLAIPKHDEIGKRLRSIFKCKDGEVFGAWDLSQIEMRVLADESKDRLLCRLFNEGRDVHQETASRIFDIPLNEVTSKERTPSKRAGFGLIYGISGRGLSTQLHMLGLTDWDAESCDRLINEWLKVYKGVQDYTDCVRCDIARDWSIRDRWGMIRYLPKSKDPKTDAQSLRFALSHRIQGRAQGMIQNSMVWLDKQLSPWRDQGIRVNWCLQIHDEIMLIFEREYWDVLDSLVLEALTVHHGARLTVPVCASGTMADTWAGL